MKNFLFIIFIFNFFIASGQNFFYFGAKQKFFLSNNEYKTLIDSNVLNKYKPYNKSIIYQIPLNRYATGNNYVVFIGLSIYKNIDEIKNFWLYDVVENKISSKDTTIKKINFSNYFFKYNNNYNYTIIFESKKTFYPAVITFVSNDSTIISKFYYDKNFIYNKFAKKR